MDVSESSEVKAATPPAPADTGFGRTGASWVPFVAVQLFAFILCCILVAWDPSSQAETVVVPTVFGIYYAHIVLAAVLTVFGGGTILQRLTLPPLWLALETWLAFLFVEHGPDSAEALLLAGLTTFTWMVAQIPFWCSRSVLNVRLRAFSLPIAPQSDGEQFSVRQLLIFTFVIAIILGIGRAVVSRADLLEFFALSAEDILTFTLFVSALISSGLAVIHVGLLPQPRARSLLSTFGLILAITLGLRYALSQVITSGPPDADVVLSYSVAAQAIWLGLSVTTLRKCGWRLLPVIK